MVSIPDTAGAPADGGSATPSGGGGSDVGRMVRRGPFEVHTMPNGDTVCYRDSDHTYHTSIEERGKGDKAHWVGKGRWGDLPSPSSIAKFADPNPDPLMEYAARRTREGVVALLDLGLSEFEDADALHGALQSQKLTWRDHRDGKGDLGTMAHWAFENALRGIRTEPEGIPRDARGYVKGAMDFLRDVGGDEGFETLQNEAVVYSREHGYAGRFDGRITVPVERHDGRLTRETWMVDLKTSGFIGRAYHNQLAGYDLAAEECGYGASDRLVIVQVFNEPNEQGNYYIPWPCRGTRKGFLLNLASYEDGKRMDAETKADWKRLVKGEA